MTEEKFELPENCIFYDGKHSGIGRFYFSIYEKDEEEDELVNETLLLERQGDEWTYLGDVPWLVRTSCVWPAKDFIYVIASEDGDFAYLDSETFETDTIKDSISESFTLRRLRPIADRLYAVGYGGVILTRSLDGVWQELKLGRPSEESWLESICRIDKEKLLAVGLSGEVWEGNGDDWQLIDVPTNLNLHDVYCADNGEIYVCGDSGTLLVCKRGVWEVVETDVAADLWRVVGFNAKIFVSSMYGLYEYRDGFLVESDLMLEGASSTYYNLDATENSMFIVDERRAVLVGKNNISEIYVDQS